MAMLLPAQAPAGRYLRVLAACLGALALIAAGVLLAREYFAARALKTEVAAVYRPAHALPAFTLVGDDGLPFPSSRLRGRWSLVYFGFTACADACPAAMTELKSIKSSLADLPATDAPQVLFITVDPERDDPARLKAYVGAFDPAFRGLTGDAATLESVNRAFFVAVNRGKAGDDGTYAVDHSSALYLIDPQGRLVALFPAPHRTAAIGADYRAIVKASGRG
jgi:protein SCO1/2